MRYLLVLIVALSSIANAEVNKCKAANERVTYSSTPCKKSQSIYSFNLKKNKTPTNAYTPDMSVYNANSQSVAQQILQKQATEKVRKSREMSNQMYDLERDIRHQELVDALNRPYRRSRRY